MKQMTPEKRRIIQVVLVALALNAVVFCIAFPQAFQVPKSAPFARDFSAYYIGEWRLLHNPTQIYVGGVESGDPQIIPKPQTFKYAPSFLILFAPFEALNYRNSLAAFDVLQFALIPALAFFTYQLVKGKNWVLGSVAAVLILLDPVTSPAISYMASGLPHIRVESFSAQSISPSYYCGYMLGNAHVLQTVLLVGALYFGFTKKPWLSALLFAFGILDPRSALLALPLLIWYNRSSILKFVAGTAGFLAITNLPFFFYNGVGFAFLKAELNGNIASQFYPYDWIPIYSIAALTAVEMITVIGNHGVAFSFPLTRKTRSPEQQNK